MFGVKEYRVGSGTDFHRLVEGRPFILGGVTIPHHLGLLGHSDGDALVHALIDALLGAAGKSDIGTLFPSSSVDWKGANSISLLRKVWAELKREKWEVVNIDCTVVAEAPPINPVANQMKENLASVLEITTLQVGIKATTAEGLGAIGRQEGIMVNCVALLERQKAKKSA